MQAFNFTPLSELELDSPKPLMVEAIDVKVLDVFNLQDPEENRWYGRWANKLHVATKEHVILAQLLFKVGDVWSKKLAAESERILRSNQYLFDARIRVSEVCANRVKVEVTVRDVWTLTGGVSGSRSGGENSYRTSLTDRNFLGLGVKLSLSRSRNSERKSEQAELVVPNLFYSRWGATLFYRNQDDGQGHFVGLTRPFYALHTPYAINLNDYQDSRIDSLYFRNQVTDRFKHQTEQQQFWYGRVVDWQGDTVNRWLIGYNVDRHFFLPLTDDGKVLPQNRSRNHLWLSWQSLQDKFEKRTSFNRIGQTEDIYVGRETRITLGYGDSAFGDQDAFWQLSASYRSGFSPQDGELGFVDLDMQGFWLTQQNDWQNLRATAQLQWYIDPFSRSQWYFSLLAKRSVNHTLDQRLLLGGDTGLRGYPARYQLGDRSFIASIEKRVFFDWQLARTFNFGFAFFADVGRAWFPGRDNGVNGGVLTDVGFGLRVTSSRFDLDKVLHIDLAFPLQREDGNIDRVQLLVSGKTRF